MAFDAATLVRPFTGPVQWGEYCRMEADVDRVLDAMRAAAKTVSVFAASELAGTVRGSLLCDMLAERKVPAFVCTDVATALLDALRADSAVEVVSREGALVGQGGERLYHTWRNKGGGAYLVRSDPRMRRAAARECSPTNTNTLWADVAEKTRPAARDASPANFEAWAMDAHARGLSAVATITTCPEDLRTEEPAAVDTPAQAGAKPSRPHFLKCRGCCSMFMFTAGERAWYEAKKFKRPAHCSVCRAKK